ncbi:MAG: S1C family serine protease [Acidobacteriota bacterium]
MADRLKDLSDALAAMVDRNGQSVVSVVGRRDAPASGVVWPAEGLVVTASHVLEWQEDIAVGLPDGGTTTAELVGRDPATDLAVLRVSASSLAVPKWTPPDSTRVGQLVLSLARSARGLRVGLGVVSVFGGAWQTQWGGQVDHYLETDLRLSAGFSGSMLLDPLGSAIGLNTSGLVRKTSLAVPTPTVRRVVEQLLEHPQVRGGFLGPLAPG